MVKNEVKLNKDKYSLFRIAIWCREGSVLPRPHLAPGSEHTVLRGHQEASGPISSFVPSASSSRKWMHTDPHKSFSVPGECQAVMLNNNNNSNNYNNINDNNNVSEAVTK